MKATDEEISEQVMAVCRRIARRTKSRNVRIAQIVAELPYRLSDTHRVLLALDDKGFIQLLQDPDQRGLSYADHVGAVSLGGSAKHIAYLRRSR